MKIISLSTSDTLGGASRAALRLHKSLLKKSVEVKLIVKIKAQNNPTIIDINLIVKNTSNIIQLIFNRLKTKIKFFSPYYKKFASINTYLSLLGKSYLKNGLDNFEFDILHLHWVSEFINFKELQRIQKPIIWTLHDCNAFTGICHVIDNCIQFKSECKCCPHLGSDGKDISTTMFHRKKELYKNLDLHIVTPSHWLAKVVSESTLLKNSPVYVIPNGIELEKFSPLNKSIARSALGFDQDKTILLFGTSESFGDYNKGFDLLVASLKLLQKGKYQNKMILICFGTSQETPQELNFFDTKMLGKIDDDRLLRLILSSGNVLLVPSRQESFGLIAAEALACETPVIAFATSGLLDIVDHKKNGYLANSYDVDDFTNGIMWCLEQNTDNFLGKNGRIKVEQHFDIDKVADQYLDLYYSVLK